MYYVEQRSKIKYFAFSKTVTWSYRLHFEFDQSVEFRVQASQHMYICTVPLCVHAGKKWYKSFIGGNPLVNCKQKQMISLILLTL